MNTTQLSSHEKIIEYLTYLFSAAHLLEEKTRIKVYLPKALVKLMDALIQGKSRSELIKDLIVGKAQTMSKTKPVEKKLLTHSDYLPMLQSRTRI